MSTQQCLLDARCVPALFWAPGMQQSRKLTKVPVLLEPPFRWRKAHNKQSKKEHNTMTGDKFPDQTGNRLAEGQSVYGRHP